MIRPYLNSDFVELFDMLITEGIPEGLMRFKDYDTFILEEDHTVKGFFTFRREHGCMSLQHFCVSRSHRSADMARQLVKAIVNKARELGFKKMILHSKRNLTDTFIGYYFKAKPYAVEGITSFYCVKV